MSLDKAIEHGKEKRKQYRLPKLIDRTCRNHGGCLYCLSNRMYSQRKKEESMNNQLEEYYKEEEEYEK